MEKNAYEIVSLARDKDRMTSLDIIQEVFDQFQEFHGDRLYADDEAIVGGVGLLAGKPVTVVGIQKGKIYLRIYAEILGHLIQRATVKHCA